MKPHPCPIPINKKNIAKKFVSFGVDGVCCVSKHPHCCDNASLK
jgi:hypothetical protein